ncbi:MAG: 3-hydroxyacyl-ACP dehydratase FabZ family protein [Planctomycetota bacterium]
MPTAALIDFEAYASTRPIADRDQILGVLMQRGRFAMLDGILHLEEGGKRVVGFKDIRADDWWTTDHIPGRPIFPGALMIEAAAQLCSYAFLMSSPEMQSKFIGFGGLDGTRFRGVVSPPSRMIFAAELRRLRSRMFTYYAQGFVNGDLVFETEVIGVVV